MSQTLSCHVRVIKVSPGAHVPATTPHEHVLARTSTLLPHMGVHMPKVYARGRLGALATLSDLVAPAGLSDVA